MEEIEDRLVQDESSNDNDTEEQYEPHPNFDDIEFDGGMRVPGELWDCLFDYQKTCKLRLSIFETWALMESLQACNGYGNCTDKK